MSLDKVEMLLLHRLASKEHLNQAEASVVTRCNKRLLAIHREQDTNRIQLLFNQDRHLCMVTRMAQVWEGINLQAHNILHNQRSQACQL